MLPSSRVQPFERYPGSLISGVLECHFLSTMPSCVHYVTARPSSPGPCALDPDRPAFLNAFLPFARTIARAGVDNSLVQLVLKLTLPGVPDIYQGADLWDLSLVDPDNRRPVDYPERAALLGRLRDELASPDGRGDALRAMLGSWGDGAIKLAITRTLLEARADAPALFADGGYEPIEVTGADAERVLAFARAHDEHRLVVVISRFPLRGGTPNGNGA